MEQTSRFLPADGLLIISINHVGPEWRDGLERPDSLQTDVHDTAKKPNDNDLAGEFQVPSETQTRRDGSYSNGKTNKGSEERR